MKDLPLILAYARRGYARLGFTMGAILVAFLLLGLMLPVMRLFDSRVDFADASRLMVVSKTSMMTPLPVNLQGRIADVDGVERVGHFTFFGGSYRSPSNQIAAIVTDPASFPEMVGEIEFRDADQLAAWQASPSSVAVGRELAEEQGWKVGDLIPIHSQIYARKDGSPVWTFRIAAIFDPSAEGNVTNSMVIPYDYFNRERATGEDTVGWFAVQVADSRQAEAIAATIDQMFENSPNETLSTTERAFSQSFLKQVGNFKTMITAALALAFWTLLLVTGNSAMQAIRSRFGDFAIMRTLGFSKARIGRLIVTESLLMIGIAALAGMAIANVVVFVVSRQTDQLLALMRLDWRDWAIALALAVGCALIVTVLPLLRAIRQSLTDGLGEVVQS